MKCDLCGEDAIFNLCIHEMCATHNLCWIHIGPCVIGTIFAFQDMSRRSRVAVDDKNVSVPCPECGSLIHHLEEFFLLTSLSGDPFAERPRSSSL